MTHLQFLPILLTIAYPVLLILIIVFIAMAVKKYLSLKKEQNDLLREIIRKIELK